MTGIGSKETYVGDEAQALRGKLTLRAPMERGVIRDWEAMEQIIHHTLHIEMRYGNMNPTLFSERPFTPTIQRDKLSELLFEHFDVPALNFAMPEVLALWSGGRNTALVVDVGHGVTTVMPIVRGFIVRAGVVRANFGGADMTDYMQRLLTERGYYLNTSKEQQIVAHLKETSCYIPLDYEAELQTSLCTMQLDKSYDLPDGQIVTVSSERFRCTETLFQPSLMGRELPGIHQLIEMSLNKVDLNLRWILTGNIIVVGGTTMIPGFADRLQKELTNLLPRENTIRVVAAPERKYSTWIGASIMASVTPPEKWFSKEEYDEYGPAYSRRKLLYL